MMLVSLVATTCLSILVVVAIMLFSQIEQGGVKQAADNLQSFKKEPAKMETSHEEDKQFIAQGIRVYEDEWGTHDVYFEQETTNDGYEGKTGPIHIKIKKIQMERLYPAGDVGTVIAEGKSEVTLVAVSLQVTNINSKQAFFELDTVRGKVDNGEVSKIEALLSDDFDNIYEPKAKREGTIYFMYKGSPNNLAMLTMNFSSAEDANFRAIDKGTNMKVRLY